MCYIQDQSSLIRHPCYPSVTCQCQLPILSHAVVYFMVKWHRHTYKVREDRVAWQKFLSTLRPLTSLTIYWNVIWNYSLLTINYPTHSNTFWTNKNSLYGTLSVHWRVLHHFWGGELRDHNASLKYFNHTASMSSFLTLQTDGLSVRSVTCSFVSFASYFQSIKTETIQGNTI